MNNILNLSFSPLFTSSLLWFFLLSFLVAFTLVFWYSQKKLLWRIGAVIVLLLLILNPLVSQEQQEPLPDIVTIIVDDSPSQHLTQRQQRTEHALQVLQQKLAAFPSLEVVVLRKKSNNRPTTEIQTNLFNTPILKPNQHAATLVITDGQIHDVPVEVEHMLPFAPVHVLLTGQRDEVDRTLTVEQAPSYGIVGQDVTVYLRIDDSSPQYKNRTTLTVHHINTGKQQYEVTVGETFPLTLPIEHAGPNLFDLSIDVHPHELTPINNHVSLSLNGIHDRLQVLLLSGEPHNGGRVWRNILKTEPNVDLIHFTILRTSSNTSDDVPLKDLSLIPFPVKELFEKRLPDFHLIILDRYKRRGLINDQNLQSVIAYIHNGGALLESSGPSFSDENQSIFFTALKDVLPGKFTGQVLEQPFIPQITHLGQYHPVTEIFATDAIWGQWFRQIVVQNAEGLTVMSGINNSPLLILHRVGKGRVAQITSDQIWLWARNNNGQNPHYELLRRVIHWLMKEPQLEENRLTASINNNTLTIERSNLLPNTQPVTLTTPDGTQQTITLLPVDEEQRKSRRQIPLEHQFGLYHIQDEQNSTVVSFGTLDMPEYRNMRTTEEHVTEITQKTGGGIYWLEDFTDTPDVRYYHHNTLTGKRWLGVRANDTYTVIGIENFPLLWFSVTLLLALFFLLAAWYLEGRS